MSRENEIEVRASWAWAERFGRGLPTTALAALAYAYQRVNGRVDQAAYMLPALVTRDLSFVAGGGVQQTTIQIGTALLVTSISQRCFLDNAADDTSMLVSRVQLPNQQGYLLGDPSSDANIQVLAENATWLPLLIPWLLLPQDQAVYIGTASAALAGNATLSLGLAGAWIYGLT